MTTETTLNCVRRVVVAGDFSQGADAAVARGTRLAKAHGARVELGEVSRRAAMSAATSFPPRPPRPRMFADRLHDSTALDVIHHTARDVLVVS